MRHALAVLFFLLCLGGPAFAGNPVPFLNAPLVPTSVGPGSGAFTLTVNGGGFVSGAVVDWNGQPLATTFVSGTRLTAIVPAGDIAAAGSAEVTVANPGTGARSNVEQFLVATPGSGVFYANAPSSPFGHYLWPQGLWDFTGNGIMDILMMDIQPYNPPFSAVLLGDGSGAFSPPSSQLPAGFETNPYVVGDFNGDDRLDLLAGGSSGAWQVFWGNGDGTFAPGPTVPLPGGQTPVGMADFNGDGKLDLLSETGQGTTPTTIEVLWGNGTGAFASGPSTTLPSGLALARVPVWDFNADGKPDLLLENGFETASASFQVLLGNGDGTFTPVPGTPMNVGPAGYTAAVADFNGDGKLDLAVPNGLYGYAVGADTPSIAILLGNGDGTFTQVPNCCGTPGQQADNILTGDFNDDGKLDLAVTINGNGAVGTDPAGYIEVFLGNGDGTFTPTDYSMILTGLGDPTALYTADVNEDGKLDFIVGDNNIILNWPGNQISALLQGPAPNPAPDFTISPSSPSVSVAPGATATDNIQIASVGGYLGPAPSLTCGGAPYQATCTVQQPTGELIPAATGSFPLTVTTTAPTASSASGLALPPTSRWPALAWLGLLAVAALYERRGHRRHSVAGPGAGHGPALQRGVALFGALLLGLALLGACGGQAPAAPRTPPAIGGTPPGTYTLTVTATSGSITHSTTFTLTVE
ncbi:MAG: FG-GAP-like repeat-containing protein [Acidobacteriota bacterium]